MVVGVPRQLNHGKTSWHTFAGCCEFFDIVKPSEAGGVVISFYCMDGLMHSACKRMLRVRHEMEEHIDHEVEQPERDDVSQLSDWHLYMRCKSHATQLSVLWALRPFCEEGLSSDAHNCIRSLRSNAADLIAHLDSFLMAKMRYTDRGLDCSEVRCFWQAMSVRLAMLELFVMVDPIFVDGELLVGQRLALDPDT